MDSDALLDAYAAWFRNGFSVQHCAGWDEITTPFLDYKNDCVQVYIRPTDDGIVISDDSATICDLASGGCLSTELRTSIAGIASRYGVTVAGMELVAKATENQFPQQLHMFIMAVLQISSLAK